MCILNKKYDWLRIIVSYIITIFQTKVKRRPRWDGDFFRKFKFDAVQDAKWGLFASLAAANEQQTGGAENQQSPRRRLRNGRIAFA